MAKYRKADNCGPVPYPDQSGRFLGEGEVSDRDDWEPYVALGFVVKVDDTVAVTPDRQETPEELANAVEISAPEPASVPELVSKTVTEMAKEAAAESTTTEITDTESVGETVREGATKAAKKKKKAKKGTKSSDVSGD